jgi:hypothetical protein
VPARKTRSDESVRLTVLARYALYVAVIGGWVFTFNVVTSKSEIGAAALVVGTFGFYWFKRWRVPKAITRTATGAFIAESGKPIVVEFYSDL